MPECELKVTEIPYVGREDIMSALDVKPSAFMARQIDRAALAGSRMVDGFCHRSFAPVVATRTFDYPGPRATSRRIYFDQYDLISTTAVTSDGVSFTQDTDYYLRPDNGSNEPFTFIELNRDSSRSFAGGPQRAVSIAGLWGYSNVEVQPTTLVGAVASTSATTLTVTAPAGDVGSLIRVDSERMLITEKAWTASPATTSALLASASSNTITTTDSELFTPFERLLIDGERLEVLDIAGDVITVRRAVDGTTLAAHGNGTAIYWQHSLSVLRGAAGTTAATHSSAAPVYRWVPPSPISALARAYALDTFLQENAGYARTSGQGENERPVYGRAIKQLEERVRPNFVRSARHRAV